MVAVFIYVWVCVCRNVKVSLWGTEPLLNWQVTNDTDPSSSVTDGAVYEGNTLPQCPCTPVGIEEGQRNICGEEGCHIHNRSNGLNQHVQVWSTFFLCSSHAKEYLFSCYIGRLALWIHHPQLSSLSWLTYLEGWVQLLSLMLFIFPKTRNQMP